MSKLQLDSRIGCRTCRSDLQLDRSARLDGLDPEACLRDNPEIKLRDGLAANVRFRYAVDLFLAITRTRSRDVLRHQTWIALTRGGPERPWITWVSSTISMFFVRQYFVHPMFVDEKFTRRHRSAATDSRYNHRILVGIGGDEPGNDGVIFIVFRLLLQAVEQPFPLLGMLAIFDPEF